MTVLDDALVAWRGAPTPELAALVVRAGALVGDGREAISGVDHAGRQKMWLAVEKKRDAADLDRLLATLVDCRCAEAMVRMALLVKRPHDPRFLEKLIFYLEADPKQSRGVVSPVPFTSGPNRKFWNALLPIVEDRIDASHVARLEVVAARNSNFQSNFQTWLHGKCADLAEVAATRALPAAKPATITKLDGAIAKLEAQAKPKADTGDALWQAVWAAPDDDAPRIVLADFLSERGDPRGEFIMLQLARAAGTIDAAGKKREKELMKRHKKQWLGPIAPLIQLHYLRFERGFLVTCSLEPNADLEKSLGNHPAWSTICEYLVHGYAGQTAKPLAKMLKKHGATETSTFTRGIE